MKLYLTGFLFLCYSSNLVAENNLRTIELDLSYFSGTQTWEIITSNADEISDSKLLSTTSSSGILYFSQILYPNAIAQYHKSSDMYVTSTVAQLSNSLIKGNFLICSSKETPIRKYDQSLLGNAKFMNEFCYSEPTKQGYYFEYRVESDKKEVVINASSRARCRYTCMIK